MKKINIIIVVIIFLIVAITEVHALTFINGTFPYLQDTGERDFAGNPIVIGDTSMAHGWHSVDTTETSDGKPLLNTRPVYQNISSVTYFANTTIIEMSMTHAVFGADQEARILYYLHNQTYINNSYFSMKFKYIVESTACSVCNAERFEFGGCYFGSTQASGFRVGKLAFANIDSNLNYDSTACTTDGAEFSSGGTYSYGIAIDHNVTINFAFGKYEIYVDKFKLYNTTMTNASGNTVQSLKKVGFRSITDDNPSYDNEYAIDDFTLCSGVLNCTQVNQAPAVSLNFPNSNKTHNKTIVFNFTISDFDGDKLNYTLFADTNSNPITQLNSSNNTFQENSTFLYTFSTAISNSINGTYSWKINGTDNQTAFFTSNSITFNITNNRDNLTNVTINSSAIQIGDTIRGFFNMTSVEVNGQTDNDLCITNWTRFYVNNTNMVTAENNTILNSPNVTLNANITFSASCYDGYGATGQTEWKNTTTITVGDTTLPIFINSNINPSSITDGTETNISANYSDNSYLLEINMTVRSPTGKLINRSCQNINQPQYNCLVAFFDGDETSEVGTWNLTRTSAIDSSRNTIYSYPNTTLQVTAVSGSTTIVQAGGGAEPAKSGNKTFDLQTENFGQEYFSVSVQSNSIKELTVFIFNNGNKTLDVSL